MKREISGIDQVIQHIDNGLRCVFAPSVREAARPSPALGVENGILTTAERQKAIGLMRVNHSGEVCAQALYQGQACFARTPQIQAQLQQAAVEETDHLAWCEARLQALGGHTSLLNPLWYSLSWGLGMVMGAMGDALSLGFVAAVEQQVEAHLAAHLQALPEADRQSFAVLTQMQKDEQHHAAQALQAGGQRFPAWIQQGMQWIAKSMTFSSFYV